MTDETTTETPETDKTPQDAEETPQDAEEPAEDPEQDDDEPSGRKGNPEAAKWRTRYREAETRLETMRRAEIVRQATGPGRLIDGEDLFRVAEVADLLDDDGNLDADKISTAVSGLVESKPHLARPAFGDGVGIGERSPATGTSWADVIRG